jgi:hypothetical protein
MKGSEVKKGDVIVIGHQASNTLKVTTVRPLDIEWSGENVVPKAGTAFNITGVLENGAERTITVQGDDEVEV